MGDLALHVAQVAERGRAVPAEVRDDFAEMGRLAVAMARKAAEVARTRNVILAAELDGRRRRDGPAAPAHVHAC